MILTHDKILKMTMIQAILGGSVEVLTLDGLVDLKIPAGAQPEARLVMSGKGIKKLNSSKRLFTQSGI